MLTKLLRRRVEHNINTSVGLLVVANVSFLRTL